MAKLADAAAVASPVDDSAPSTDPAAGEVLGYDLNEHDPGRGPEFCGRSIIRTVGTEWGPGATDSNLLLRLLLECVEGNLDISQVANRILLFRAANLEFRPPCDYLTNTGVASVQDFPESDRTWFRESRQVDSGQLLDEEYRSSVEDIVRGWVHNHANVLQCAEDLRWALHPGPARCICVHTAHPDFVIPPVQYLYSWASGRQTRVREAEIPRL